MLLPAVKIVLKFFKANMSGAPTASEMAKKLGFRMVEAEKLVKAFNGSAPRRYGFVQSCCGSDLLILCTISV